jgi:hypothetical protein
VIDPALIAAGFTVGFLVGLTGIGGGSLMTPALIFFAGVKPSVAVGTDLVYAFITKSAGSIAHMRQGTAHKRTVLLLLTGSVPGSIIAGVLYTQAKSAMGESLEHFILKALGAALLAMAAVLIIGVFRAVPLQPALEEDRERGALFLSFAGFVVGFLMVFTSVGSGTLITAALFTLRPWLGASRIVGTDILHAAVLIPVAAVGHITVGSVDYMMAANLVIGSIPAVLLGSRFSVVMPERALRTIVGGVLAIAGIKLI